MCTIITVTRGAIQRGFKCPDKLWQIPLVDMVRNNNTETVIVNRPPTEFLPERPPPIDAIHNVYELKTQPELVRYYHARQDSPQSQRGLEQSRTTTMHRGQVSQQMPSPSTTLTPRKQPRDTAGKHQAASATPKQQHLHWTTVTMFSALTTSRHHVRERRNAQFFIVSWT